MAETDGIVIPAFAKLTVVSDERLEADSSYYMTSTLEEVGEDGALLITSPIHKELQVPIRTGEALRLNFFDQRAFYEFPAKVLERVRRDGLHYLRIKRTGDFVRTQRRQNFRLPVALDIKLDQVWNEAGERRVRRVPGLTVDLSGGGAYVRASIHPAVGERLVLHLPERHFRGIGRVACEVRWCFRDDRPEALWKWSFGLSFLIDMTHKEKMIRQVFALQQMERRRENGL